MTSDSYKASFLLVLLNNHGAETEYLQALQIFIEYS
jgi:hypothetical protein